MALLPLYKTMAPTGKVFLQGLYFSVLLLAAEVHCIEHLMGYCFFFFKKKKDKKNPPEFQMTPMTVLFRLHN